METYLEFLRSKIVLAKESGFELDPREVNPGLKPHQRDAVGYLMEYEEEDRNISLFDLVGGGL